MNTGNAPQRPGDARLPLVSIIVPLYNAENTIRELLNSIRNCDYRHIETVVIDDFSTDNGIELVRTEFPWTKIIQNTRNMGKSWSLNQGIDSSMGEFLVITDPDIVMDSQLLSKWIDVVTANPEIGVGGCYVYYKTEPMRLTHAGARLDRRTGRINRQATDTELEYHKECLKISSELVFDDIYILRRTSLQKTGLYDYKNFRTIYEEADLQFRIQDSGGLSAIIPGARAFHNIPPTAWGQLRRYSKYKIELLCRNRFIFLRKHNLSNKPIRIFLTLRLILYYSFVAVVQPTNLKGRLELLGSVFIGTWKGLTDQIYSSEPPLGMTNQTQIGKSKNGR